MLIFINHVISQCVYTFNNLSDYTIGYGSWDINNDGYIRSNPSDPGGIMWIGDNIPESLYWNEYTLTVSLKIIYSPLGNDYGDFGILFHAQSIASYNNGGKSMYFGARAYNTETHFMQFNNGWNLLNVTKSVIMDQENGLEMKLIVNGSYCECYVDNTLILVTKDVPYTHGSIGLRTFQAGSVYTSVIVNKTCTTVRNNPSSVPTSMPTNIPTNVPTVIPTAIPTAIPTVRPTVPPIFAASNTTAIIPNISFTVAPTNSATGPAQTKSDNTTLYLPTKDNIISMDKYIHWVIIGFGCLFCSCLCGIMMCFITFKRSLITQIIPRSNIFALDVEGQIVVNPGQIIVNPGQTKGEDSARISMTDTMDEGISTFNATINNATKKSINKPQTKYVP